VPIDAKAILIEVRANIAALDGCVGPHDFSVPYRKSGTLVMDWSCARCGGHVPFIEKHWYERGLAHGRSARG
jgi:hypothetical protein